MRSEFKTRKNSMEKQPALLQSSFNSLKVEGKVKALSLIREYNGFDYKAEPAWRADYQISSGGR